MKNTTKIILMASICLISVGIVFAGIGLIMGASPSHILYNGLWNAQFHYEDDYENDYNKDNTYSVSDQTIDELGIDWVSGSVTVVPYDGEDILIEESSRRDLDEDYCLRYKIDGNRLQIDYMKGTMGINFYDGKGSVSKKLTVKIPRKMAQNLERVEFDAVSADISISDITTNYLSADTTSGNLFANNLKVIDLEMSSISGDLRAKNLIAKSLEVDTTSGNLIGHSLKASSVQIGTVSGDMDADFLVCPKEFGFESTSGECTITLPKNSSLSVAFDSASGNFSTEYPSKINGDDEYIIGNGTYEFNVDTVSGDFTIKKAAK